MVNKQLQLSYQGQKIQIYDEMLCLTDFWKAVGRPKNKSAPQWLRLPPTINYIMRFEAKMGKSRALVENRQEGGTFAHWQIALAYAKFLSTDLEMHINGIYMRYQAGDVTLADQIADKAGPEGQEWLLKRIAKKVKAWLRIERLPENGVED
jgi:hypothetical protein